ncbi:GntR family transcriptional regulator [Halotalea alkalilenta]|uniref:GntR family transcriptional regulator n=1 Tax=Halotalea alkalilenta TaxID=376489 RepID=UPI000489BF85|nr:GntR family transcriptional regulator [Halotalea alkalilenta]
MSVNSTAEPAFARVAAQIRETILTGGLVSGMPLVEAELVERHQASRNTVREALRLLREQGLITHEPNKGVKVRRLDAEDLRDIFIVRRTLELGALRSRRSIGDGQLARMLQSIEGAQQACENENWREVGTQSLRFHQAIVSLLGSSRFDALFVSIAAQLRLLFASGADEPAFQQPWVARDVLIYRLLEEQRCAEAMDQLEAYLGDSERRLLASL